MNDRHDTAELLRRTYAEVALRTQVDTGADRPALVRSDVSPRTIAAPSRWRTLAAAAAVIAVVVGGLLVIGGRQAQAPASESALTHALAGRPPQAARPEGGAAIFPLVEILSTDDLDRMTWESDTGSVWLRTDRSVGSDRPSGQATAIRNGMTGYRSTTADGQELRWLERPGLEIAVGWTTGVDDAIVDVVVDSVFLVDDDVWRRAIDRGGFLESRGDALLERTVESERIVTVHLRGDIHAGYGLEIGPSGHLPSVDTCAAALDFSAMDSGRSDGAATPYVVFGPGSAASATVSAPGGESMTVPLVPIFPGLDMRIGTFELDRDVSADLPDVSCTEDER
jgi:hypothetical protein